MCELMVSTADNVQWLPQVQGVLKRALQWYTKCYYVASVTKTFTPKGVQTILHSRCWTMDSVKVTLKQLKHPWLSLKFLRNLLAGEASIDKLLLRVACVTQEYASCVVKTWTVWKNETDHISVAMGLDLPETHRMWSQFSVMMMMKILNYISEYIYIYIMEGLLYIYIYITNLP
jgi:hypothetical protein